MQEKLPENITSKAWVIVDMDHYHFWIECGILYGMFHVWNWAGQSGRIYLGHTIEEIECADCVMFGDDDTVTYEQAKTYFAAITDKEYVMIDF
jgi:ribonucleotide monophosphatase NagD (HAD superfamily)